jgi:site-specific DNA recombinase
MREQTEREAARQRRRLATLTGQREKLLHAHYAGAVPLDLLRQEQDRLTTEIAQAEAHLETAERFSGDVQATLDMALDLLANCHRAYRKVPGHLRRQFNQALYERLLVHDDRITGAKIAEPFATLADPDLPQRLDGGATGRTAASSGGGSNEALKVGMAGFEPAASASRTLRANQTAPHPEDRSF